MEDKDRCPECGERGWHPAGCLSGALLWLEAESQRIRDDIARNSPNFVQRFRSVEASWKHVETLAKPAVEADLAVWNGVAAACERCGHEKGEHAPTFECLKCSCCDYVAPGHLQIPKHVVEGLLEAQESGRIHAEIAMWVPKFGFVICWNGNATFQVFAAGDLRGDPDTYPKHLGGWLTFGEHDPTGRCDGWNELLGTDDPSAIPWNDEVTYLAMKSQRHMGRVFLICPASLVTVSQARRAASKESR